VDISTVPDNRANMRPALRMVFTRGLRSEDEGGGGGGGGGLGGGGGVGGSRDVGVRNLASRTDGQFCRRQGRLRAAFFHAEKRPIFAAADHNNRNLQSRHGCEISLNVAIMYTARMQTAAPHPEDTPKMQPPDWKRTLAQARPLLWPPPLVADRRGFPDRRDKWRAARRWPM